MPGATCTRVDSLVPPGRRPSPAAWPGPHLLFDGKHGEPDGGVSELRVQNGRVKDPLPDDGGKPGGQDQHIRPPGGKRCCGLGQGLRQATALL